jgi:glutaredoxin
MSDIKVYGAEWCEDTQQTRRHLKQLGLRYDYVNIDFDPRAREFVKFQNDGKQVTPTVVIAGDVLVEPSDEELDTLLRQKALMPGMSRGQ